MTAARTTPAADLRHIDTWLFDLDNTLYPVESGFMASLSDRMTDFVELQTGLPRDEARALQKRYLSEYGLTLRGLMLNHGVDADAYHAIFHDLSLDSLAHDPDMLAALQRLPGRRLIFTNADDKHAERVLKHLGLDHLFEDVFHIGSFDFLPKPDPEAFRQLIAGHGIDAAATAFFEDAERNLAPAAALGMTTVLVGPHAEASTAGFVDFRTHHLAPFLHGAHLREA